MNPSYIDATPVPLDVATEPWSEEAAAWRLDRLRPHLPIVIPTDATFAGGQANDAWLFGGEVLRVCCVDLIPLPLPRLEVVASLARFVPHVDPGLVDAAVARIGELAQHDPFTPDMDGVDACVVHGDATAANILVHDGRITGLIDFEYARWAPRDLELLSPVTFGMGFGVGWLQEDYPALFAGEHVRGRVWLYELCCAVRNLVWWPPESPQRGDGTDHPPIQRLRDLIEAPTPW